jgi:hypothetical protein
MDVERNREWMQLLRKATACLIVAATMPLLVEAQLPDRDPNSPPISFKHEGKRLPNPKLKWRLGSTVPKAFSEPLTLSQQSYSSIIELPLGDGTVSSWAVTGYDMGGPDGLDYDISWGFNTASGTRLDPTKNAMELSFETNYLWNDTHYAEAYLAFSSPSGICVRPWHVGIPYTGPNAGKPIMLIMTDWLGIMDETNTIQRAKFGPTWFSLARDYPFYFSQTDGCAGCLPDVGLRPAGAGQLEVIQWLPGSGAVPGYLLAAGVNAATLAGDGSAVTNLNASAITSGTISEARLPVSVLRASNGAVSARGDVIIQGKLQIAEGADKTVGQVLLQYGQAAVLTKAVKSTSRIFLSYAGVDGQPGTLYSSDIVDGTSFVIHSTSVTDNSPVNYWIIN